MHLETLNICHSLTVVYNGSHNLQQVSCSWDGTVKIWDLTLSQPVCTLEGHPDVVYDITCCPADPRIIATCGRKGTLILWDIAAKGMDMDVLCNNNPYDYYKICSSLANSSKGVEGDQLYLLFPLWQSNCHGQWSLWSASVGYECYQGITCIVWYNLP